MVSTLTMGYKPPAPPGLSRGNGEATTGWSRVTYLGKTTQPLYVIRGGVRMGRNQAGTSWAAPVLYSGTSSTSGPGPLVARTNTLALTTFMDGGSRSGGANMEAAVQTVVLIPANTHLYGGFWVSSGDIGYGQDLSGAMMYMTRPPQGHGGSPNNPWNETSRSNQGNIDTWWVFETNDAPSPPTPIAPLNGGQTSDTSPDISMRFLDANTGDAVSKWLIELWDASNTTMLYSSGVVNAPTGVSGSTITWNPGTIVARTYRVRGYVWDRGGAKSAAGQWTFTINPGGTFTNVTLFPGVGTMPDGARVYNDTTPDSVTVTWTHQTGESLSQYEVAIFRVDTGEVVRAWVSTDIPDVPPGTAVTIPWQGSWAALPTGPTRYRWGIGGDDAIGGHTSLFSPSFVINAVPTSSAQSPASGSTRSNTARGTLSYTVSDSSDAAGAHAGSFDISTNGGSTWTRYAGTHVGGGTYQLTLTSTHMPTNATYSWREYVADPWGLTATGSWKTLNIVDPPALSSIAPSGTISVGTPTITATVDRTVATYQIVVRTASGELVLDTDTVAGSGSVISVAMPAGRLRNNTDYVTTYTGTASDGLMFTVTQAWRLQYIPRVRLDNVSIETIRSSKFDRGVAPQRPNVVAEWDRLPESTVSETDWIGYIVHRYDGNGAGRTWLIRNRDVTAFVDRSAGRGQHDWYVGYRYYENAGADIVESELVKASIDIAIRHATITLEDGDTAATLKFWTDRSVPQNLMTEAKVPLGREKPYGFQSHVNYDSIRMVGQPFDDENGIYTANELVEAMRSLAATVIGPDGTPSPQPLWWRDPKGRAFRFMFTSGVTTRDNHLSDRSEVEFEGVEVFSDEIVPMVQPTAVLDVS